MLHFARAISCKVIGRLHKVNCAKQRLYPSASCLCGKRAQDQARHLPILTITCLQEKSLLRCPSTVKLPAISQVSSFLAVSFLDADITFQSIDGVLFKVHKCVLVILGHGFLKSIESSIDSERMIYLPKNSLVLELLFQYVYSCFCLSLDDVESDVVEALRNAREV